MLLPSNMADPKSMRKHEVFLNLKRDLALVSPSPNFYFLFFIFFTTLFSFFVYFIIMLLSLAGYSSRTQGRGDSNLLI